MRHNSRKFARRAHWLGVLSLLGSCHALAATVIGPGAPSAGALSQEIRPATGSFTMPAPTGLVIQPIMDATVPDTESFMVTKFEISGNKVYATPLLHALVASAQGQSMNLKGLGSVVARISDYYHAHGYPLARAFVPAQEVVGGVVKIEVLEGKLGEVVFDNKSRVDIKVLESILAPLKSEDAIKQVSLDRAMLMLSDVPGVLPAGLLKPGKAVGSADLQVDVPASPPVRGNVSIDNQGNPYLGRARIGGLVELINPLRLGDQASLSVITSGKNLSSLNLSYEALVNGQGTSAGAAVSALRYNMGGALTEIAGHGSANSQSVWGKQVLLRSLPTSAYVQLQLDRKALSDRIDSIALKGDRALTSASVIFNGMHRDSLLGGGQTNLSATLKLGKVLFSDPDAAAIDTSAANTAGKFGKLGLSLSRLQSITPSSMVYVSVLGQLSNKNLDPSEKMVLGGANSVRAYDSGVLSADQGLVASLEFRQELGLKLGAQWQALAFFDTAHASISKTPWLGSEGNSVTMSGAGIGVGFATDYQLRGRLTLAKRIGAAPAVVGTAASSRVWAELSQGF